MKALTLYQPWADLIALGAKRIETRSWGTKYRGPLAIHAAKTFPSHAKTLATLDTVFASALGLEWGDTYEPILGAVIAVCNLVDCVKVEQTDGIMAWLEQGYVADDVEFQFGDYTPGRYGWIMREIKQVDPVPARGQQGLWNLFFGENRGR